MIDIPAALHHLTQRDPVLAGIIERVGSFQMAMQEPGFATLVDAIISQQISTKAADTIGKRLLASVGAMQPAAFQKHSPESLRSLGISRQKASSILDLVDKVESGQLDLDTLPHLESEAVIKQLTQVRGIGRWTAEMYLMFALGRPNILPVKDLGLQQAVKRAYQLEMLPNPATLQTLAQPWDPYCTVACWYLWRSLA